MKLQQLAVIFVIIVVPISLVLSMYTNNNTEVLRTQAEYNNILLNATNDAVNIRLELEGAIGKDDLDILIKVYVERYTYKEVSALYGITVDAAKKRVQRAKAKLRLELEK